MNGRFTFAGSGQLGPHLLDALQDHVAVPVEGLHPAEKLLVVSAVDQDLSVVLDGVGQDGEGSSVELLLLGPLQLLGGHLGLGLGRHFDVGDLAFHENVRLDPDSKHKTIFRFRVVFNAADRLE